MTRITTALGGAALALTLGAAGQVAAYHAAGPSATTMHASWAFHPKTVRQLIKRPTTVSLVRVLSTDAGPDIVTDQKGEPNGMDRIPTQRVVVEVLDTLRGTARPGDQLTLFQTGGAVLPAAPKERVKGEAPEAEVHQLLLEGDPGYQRGQQYLLMLEAGPQETLRPVSPEGRYRYNPKTKRLSPMVKGVVTRKVSALDLPTLAKLVKQIG